MISNGNFIIRNYLNFQKYTLDCLFGNIRYSSVFTDSLNNYMKEKNQRISINENDNIYISLNIKCTPK